MLGRKEENKNEDWRAANVCFYSRGIIRRSLQLEYVFK